MSANVLFGDIIKIRRTWSSLHEGHSLVGTQTCHSVVIGAVIQVGEGHIRETKVGVFTSS